MRELFPMLGNNYKLQCIWLGFYVTDQDNVEGKWKENSMAFKCMCSAFYYHLFTTIAAEILLGIISTGFAHFTTKTFEQSSFQSSWS